MRFFTFHYMTYQGIDIPRVMGDTGIAWATLPNSECDPQIQAANYTDYVGQAEFADELGFDGVTVNEHHQTPMGTMPSPNMMAAAISQRTENCWIAACQMGTMSDEMAKRNMRVFAEKVMPVVRREIDRYLDDLYPNRTQSQITLSAARN